MPRNLFALKELGNIYTRIMNPTQAVLEERVAALEGGVAALALASGQAASLFAVQNICHAGDNFVCSTDIYGGTWNLFQNTMGTMGIECRFVDPADPENFRRATDAKTRCYYGETLPNPKLAVFPIAEVAKIGDELGVPLIMDNTACPVLCQPIQHGAAITMHSTTKYIGGHGTSIGGIIVDGGKFDWEKHADRFPDAEQARPELSRRGVDAGRQAARPDRLYPQGPRDPAARPWRRDVAVQRLHVHSGAGDAGAAHAPALRQRERGGGLSVQACEGHEGDLPGQMSGEAKRRADAYLKGGYGGLLGFELKGGRDAGPQIHRRAEDVLPRRQYRRRALARDPSRPRTTHSQLTPEEQLKTGVTEGYVRLSIGIEHIDDILADLEQALAKA